MGNQVGPFKPAGVKDTEAEYWSRTLKQDIAARYRSMI
jgi:hypothetical protein